MIRTAEEGPVTFRLGLWGRLVAFPHSIFALPFALGMFVLCAARFRVSLTQFLLILVCLVAARTAAMACNRVLDARIDASNPRTLAREIPSGRVSLGEASLLWAASTCVFLGGAYLLGSHCLLLTPVVLLVLFGYSLTKRFTPWSHLVLGFALALAPGGVWYALTATWSLLPVPLMTAVLFWVAGFDVLYSCQDEAFDRSQGLFSVPARFGVARAFAIAKTFHGIAVLLLILFGFMWQLTPWYYVFVAVFAAFLVKQYSLISPEDLSRIDAAFFTQNGLASFSFLISTIVEWSLFSSGPQ
ncbi:MAG: putative 4-hydroxybenzoate polyprenyltransferase [Bdellovibrionales bacterium]|nr:putative 4-hydroxybenzoate polyprenyltransferase [Bdellovibrionales bacterium]